jgi:hypothetical protein
MCRAVVFQERIRRLRKAIRAAWRRLCRLAEVHPYLYQYGWIPIHAIGPSLCENFPGEVRRLT